MACKRWGEGQTHDYGCEWCSKVSSHLEALSRTTLDVDLEFGEVLYRTTSCCKDGFDIAECLHRLLGDTTCNQLQRARTRSKDS